MAQRWRLKICGLMLASLAGVAFAGDADKQARQASGRRRDGEDRERGFSDGLNGRSMRSLDRDYRAGHRAGRAKQEANEARPDGRDYAPGYRDGFNRYRERRASGSGNRAYAAGYEAGRADHLALLAPATPAGPPPTSVDKLVGRAASGLDQDMKALGYERTGQFKVGAESFTKWRSPEQNSCVQVMAREGRVQQVSGLGGDGCS
jgi:hypothetical protein